MNENIKYLYTQFILRKDVALIIARSIEENEAILESLYELAKIGTNIRTNVFTSRLKAMKKFKKMLINQKDVILPPNSFPSLVKSMPSTKQIGIIKRK